MSRVTLANVSEAIVDCEHKTAPAATPGTEYAYSVGTPHLRNGRILLSQSKRVDKSTYEAWTARAEPREDDLILAREAPVGQVGRVGPNERICLGQRTVLIRANKDRIHPRFLHYLLLAPDTQDQMHSKASGSTVAHLNVADIRGIELPKLPIRTAQEAVANLLGALDDKIAVNDSCIQTAHHLMRLHFQRAMNQGIVTTTIGDIASVLDGPHATPAKTTSGPWFLSISSLQNGRLVLDESAHLGEDDFARWTRRVTPKAGDVLFSYETRLGEAALMSDGIRACLGRRMALLRARDAGLGAVGSMTLLQAFLSESFQETIRRRAIHGATVDRIPLIELPAWPIVVPQSADKLEIVLEALNKLTTQRERESQCLASVREAILPRLMSGEIRVREAEKAMEEAQ